MKINDKYEVIGVDERNVGLVRIGIAEKGKNAGEETKTVIGYYPSVNDALKSMIKKEILGDGMKDLESINNKINELYYHIDEALKK